MDTKRLFMMMMLAFAVIFGWRIFVEQLYKAHPEWKRPGQTSETASTQPSTAQSAASTTTQGATTAAVASSQPSGPQSPLRVMTAATQPAVVTLGQDKAFNMLAALTSRAAAIESITLKEHKGSDAKTQYVFQTPYDTSRAETYSLATRSIAVNGGTPLDIANAVWSLESSDDKSAVFALDLGQVRVRKTYELSDAKSPGKGYELSVRHEVINPGGEPLNVQLVYSGPVTPPRETVSGPDVQIISAYDGGYEKAEVQYHMIEEYSASAPERDLTKGDDNRPLLWAGALSVYFDALLRPEPLAADSPVAKYLSKVTSTVLNPGADPHLHHVTLTFQTESMQVPAGGTLSLQSRAFFGPRWRKVLNDPHYANFPLNYDTTLVLTSGICGWCTFQRLINGLVWLLNIFHWLFGGFANHGDWGLAIIALVVLVRSLLHPITKKSQISMMRMGKLGPEIERLKNKHKDDKDALNKEVMQLYKDQGIGMYLGCLPMFLQMPIWIALWSALQSTFELRQAPFLWGLTWIDDLARPDMLIPFHNVFIPKWLPLIGGVPITGINLLPLLLGVVFYLQQKFTPQPPSTTPEQEMQKKMMLWMSVFLFPLFLYNGPSGLNLYILTSTTIGIIESKRIRDHIKQKEEDEKAGKIIVDAPKSMKKRGDRGDDDRGGGSGAKKKTPPAPKGGLSGWLAQIKAKAQEIQRQAEKK